MHLWLAIILYIVILFLRGMRHYLLKTVLTGAPGGLEDNQGQRFKALNINWYRWMARDVKDWVITGILGFVSLSFLKTQQAWLVPGLVIFLDLALLADACVSVFLWLYAAGCPVPGRLIDCAVSLALPDLEPAGSRRIAGWGAVFTLAAIAGLAGWTASGDFLSLGWSFITLTMGFFSLIKWLTLESKPWRLYAWSGQKK